MKEQVEEFLSYFEKTELEQEFMKIESALQNKSESSTEIIRGIFREIHSLKGTASILKIELIVQFLHDFEEALGVISKNVDRIEEVLDKTIFDFFLESLDVLESLCLSLRDQHPFTLKDHKPLLYQYVLKIVNARKVVEKPSEYFVFSELDEEMF